MELSFTFRNVVLGTALLGVIGGVIGCFAFLRRQSLLGDALAHAALPGVCLAFVLTGRKDPIVLLAGALVAGTIGALVILGLVRGSRLKEDAAIGIVLSVFFGFGIVLLTWIQKLPGGNQSGLDKFLFGQAATLVGEDLRLMALLGAGVLACVALFFKEFKLVSFDPAFAASLGFPVRWVEVALTTLLVVVVVVGLQTVGVVLMVATLLTPAAAARQWTDRLGPMLVLSGGIGAGSGVVGAAASALVPRLPTGPAVVLVSTASLGLSLLLSPRRGILRERMRQRAVRGRVREENLLKDLWLVGERRGRERIEVPLPEVMGMRGRTASDLRSAARRAVRTGGLERVGDALRLTPAGQTIARRIVRKHRLWELYLARRLDLPSDHVHRDAEAMEHALSDRAVEDLDRLLGYPDVDPHGRAIPREEGTR